MCSSTFVTPSGTLNTNHSNSHPFYSSNSQNRSNSNTSNQLPAHLFNLSNQTSPCFTEATKKRSFLRALSQTKPDPFVEPAPYLWHADHIPDAPALLTHLFSNQDTLSHLKQLFSEGKASRNAFYALLHQALYRLEKSLNESPYETRVSHREILYLHHLTANFINEPNLYYEERIAPLTNRLFLIMANKLSYKEQGQLARFLNLLELPDSTTAQKLRNLFQPLLFVKFSSHQHSFSVEWPSTQAKLNAIQTQIDEKLYHSRSSHDSFHLENLKKYISSLLDDLRKGEEIYLPKYSCRLDQLSPSSTIFTTQHIQSLFDLPPGLNFIKLTFLDESHAVPVAVFDERIEWHAKSSIRQIVEVISNQQQFSLLFSKGLPICYPLENQSVEMQRIAFVAVGMAHMDSQKEFLVQRQNNLSILPLDTWNLLIPILGQFALLLPIKHKDGPEFVVSNKRLRATPTSSSPAFYTATNSSSVSISPRLSSSSSSSNQSASPTQTQPSSGTPSPIKPAIQNALKELLGLCNMSDSKESMKRLAYENKLHKFLAKDNGLLYSKLMSKIHSSEGQISISFKLLVHQVFTYSELVEEATKNGLYQIPPDRTLPNLNLTISVSDLESMQRTIAYHSALMDKIKHYFLFNKSYPEFRNVWQHDKGAVEPTKIVGYNPLLYLNFVGIQRMLFDAFCKVDNKLAAKHQNFLEQVFTRDERGKRDEAALQLFFKNLAYQLIKESKLSHHFLIYSVKNYYSYWNEDTFDWTDELGINFRRFPNEPILTKGLFDSLSEEEHQTLETQLLPDAQPVQDNRIQIILELLSEIGRGIRNRYFQEKQIDVPSIGARLPNTPLLALLNGEQPEPMLVQPENYYLSTKPKDYTKKQLKKIIKPK